MPIPGTSKQLVLDALNTNSEFQASMPTSKRGLKELENSREDQSGLGFTQEREKLQFVRTRDSRGFGTRLDGLESSQQVQQNTNPRTCLLQTQNTPKEENSSPKRKT